MMLRRFCIALAVILLLVLVAWQTAARAATTWHYDASGKQYVITHAATSPATPAGTEITLTATVTWYDQSHEEVRAAVSEPLVLTVAPVTWTVEWIYSLPPQLEAIVDATSGAGRLETLPDGRIRAAMDLLNNGQEQSFSWRMRLKQ